MGLITGSNSNLIGNTEDANVGLSNDNITIDDCAMENVKGTNIGGITGYNSDEVKNINVENKFLMSLKGDSTNVGGIVGLNEKIVTGVTIDCNFTINSISGTQNNVGGIVGHNYKGNNGTGNEIHNVKVSKVKVNPINNKAHIIINVDGAIVFLGGVVGRNFNSCVENCYITGELNNVNNQYKGNYPSTGGIIAVSIGEDNKIIRYCYSNVLIKHHNTHNDIGTGGIVGMIGWNKSGSEVRIGVNTINNCLYANEIVVNGAVKGSANVGSVGGIIGTNWIGDSNTNNNTIIENCYMNGKIPVDPRAGGIIGLITSANSTSTINANAIYNKAYGWVGYTSTIGSKVTLNYTGVAKQASDLNTLCNGLKNEILARIDGDLTYKYIKIVITKLTNNTTNGFLQMSEWSFLDKDGNAFSWSGASIESNKNTHTGSDEGVSKLIDGIKPEVNSTTKNKYGSTFDGNTEITITLNTPIDLDTYTQYTYYTGNDDANNVANYNRRPTDWEIYFSNNKTDWIRFDKREGVTPNLGNYVQAGLWGL